MYTKFNRHRVGQWTGSLNTAVGRHLEKVCNIYFWPSQYESSEGEVPNTSVGERYKASKGEECHPSTKGVCRGIGLNY